MIPIHLDPGALSIGLIGDGPLAARRLDWLAQRGCVALVWQQPPADHDLAALNILWIADLPADQCAEVASRARALKVIVNVEDDLPFCDFHTPAVVQRGQLTVSVGTGGASPAAAGYVRRLLEAALPLAWGDVLADLAELRQNGRAAGKLPREVIVAAKAHLAKPDIAAGLLDPWRAHIKELASFPNVVCKLSGIVTEADHANWTPANLKPYIDHIIASFGLDRVMYGSDWPVCTLRTDYGRWLSTVQSLASPLNATF
ncbi:MAG: amidohydrolase family protein [Hyphomonadaceae bacterium]|nr:amidohydrolase family protein [Hyphomonadaceae bacterium]